MRDKPLQRVLTRDITVLLLTSSILNSLKAFQLSCLIARASIAFNVEQSLATSLHWNDVTCATSSLSDVSNVLWSGLLTPARKINYSNYRYIRLGTFKVGL